MNRADFFKKIGLGAIAVAVAPSVLAKEKENELIITNSPHGEFQWEKQPKYIPATDPFVNDAVRYESETWVCVFNNGLIIDLVSTRRDVNLVTSLKHFKESGGFVLGNLFRDGSQPY